MKAISEVEKYQRCYRLPTYGLQGARLERVTRDINAMPAGALYLDVGCGRGEMVTLARCRGVIACGIEIVPELASPYVDTGEIGAIHYPDGWFDFVSCFDVLEHLPPAEIDRALEELWRVCSGVLLITTNDKRSYLEELELHLTRMPRSWWDRKFIERAHREIEFDAFGRDEWHWRITL